MTEPANAPRPVSLLTEQSPPGIYLVVTATRSIYRVENPSHDLPPRLVVYPRTAALLNGGTPVPRVQEFTFDLQTGRGRIACWTAHRSEYDRADEPHPDIVRNTSTVLLIKRLRPATDSSDIPAAEWLDQVTTALRQVLPALRLHWDLRALREGPAQSVAKTRRPSDPDVVGDPTNCADSGWLRAIGPCYTAASLQRVLRLDRAGIAAAADKLYLLRLTTSDGYQIYPALQIVNDAPVPGLRDVLLALREGVSDPWTWAEWLNATPPPDRHANAEAAPPERGTRHIDRLIAGDTAAVICAAEQRATAWGS